MTINLSNVYDTHCHTITSDSPVLQERKQFVEKLGHQLNACWNAEQQTTNQKAPLEYRQPQVSLCATDKQALQRALNQLQARKKPQLHSEPDLES